MARFLTPLRYPGGKQKIAPFVRALLAENGLLGGEYSEPFAGGAGVAIELLLSGAVSKIHLNDADPGVHAFWHSILNETDEFCRRIVAASLTIPSWRRHQEVVKSKSTDLLELGFSTFFLNRCNRSGIQSGGVIGGLEQTGKWKMDARFPRNELIRRIEAIALRKDRIKLRNWDASRFIKSYIPRLPIQSLIYLDPPYFDKAERLYLHHYKPDDHAKIADLIFGNIEHPWIVSYDCCGAIKDIYSEYTRMEYSLQYNASTAYTGKEVMFFNHDMVIPLEEPTPGCRSQVV